MIYLSDCQWEDSEEVMASMRLAMTQNTTLGKYDIKHNSISDDGINTICEIIAEAKHVNMITMSEFVSGEAMEQLCTALAANKPAKGKKGKKKK